MKSITIAHLYPQEMNIYGDMGNVITLKKRLEWRGYETQIDLVQIGDEYDFASADIIFGGGGQDSSQLEVADDLLRHRVGINKAVEQGVIVLVVCGLYQLFGKYFKTRGGAKLEGIGVFDMKTVAGDTRQIGNVVLKSQWGELVGFENHSGMTELAGDLLPLGIVIKGGGNNNSDNTEGAVRNNAFGTYLHGSFLPKNPDFTDELLLRALQRKYGDDVSLEPLDDELEYQARDVAAKRPS